MRRATGQLDAPLVQEALDRLSRLELQRATFLFDAPVSQVHLNTLQGAHNVTHVLIAEASCEPLHQPCGKLTRISAAAPARINDRLPPDVFFFGHRRNLGWRLLWRLRDAGARQVHMAGIGQTCRDIRWCLLTRAPRTALCRMIVMARWLLLGITRLGRSCLWKASQYGNAIVRRRLPERARMRLRRLLNRWIDARAARRFRAARNALLLQDVMPVKGAAFFTNGPLLLVNNALAWGGAERQIVYLVKELARRTSHRVGLLTIKLSAGKDFRFYLPEVINEPVHVGDIRDPLSAERTLEAKLDTRQRKYYSSVLARLPYDVQTEVGQFMAEFLDRKPVVVHAWQDAASIAAGYAAVLTGVPRIILSSRNMRPSNFAYHRPYMRDAYAELATILGIVFVNNSEAGAADYAEWIGVPRSRFVVKRNGIDQEGFCRSGADDCATLRRRCGIPMEAPLVGSVFRFYEEKRPQLWVKAAALVGKRRPDVHFVIFGTGPLRDEALRMAKRLGLRDRLHLPGTIENASLAISAMDVFALASLFEGTPNVLLEAQLLGVPVVATDAGGTREAMSIGRSGWLVDPATADALAHRILAVLETASIRSGARIAGPQFVQERFGLQRMIEQTLKLYGVDSETMVSAMDHGQMHAPVSTENQALAMLASMSASPTISN